MKHPDLCQHGDCSNKRIRFEYRCSKHNRKTEIYDIWKIQRPLFASDGDMNMCLAYTHDKEQTAMVGMTNDDMERLFGDDVKRFITGDVRDGKLIVKELLNEQDW